MSLLNKASLIQIPSGYKDGTLYSAKPTNGDGDFTFSRGSNLAATRVNSEGLIEKGRENLTLYSQDFDNASWTKLNATVTANNTTAPDGTNTADLITSTSTNETGVYYFPSVTGINTWSIYAKKGTGRYLLLNTNTPTIATKFDLQDGVIVGTPSTGAIPSIQDVGDGWYRCSITSSTSTNRFTIFITDNTTTNDFGSSIGLTLSIWGAQLEQGLVATDYIETTTTTAQAGILEDMPRLDYSGGATCGSLLLEPQRTNSIPYSEYLGASSWTKQEMTIASNSGIAPDGTLSATKVIPTTASSTHQIETGNIISSTQCAFSVFAKADGYDRLVILDQAVASNGATFYLSTQTAVTIGTATATIEDYGNDWYRCTIVANTTGMRIYIPNSSSSISGDGTSGILIWGAQVEAGSYPTSYIPNYGSGSSVTRSADNIPLLDLRSDGLLTGTDYTYVVNLIFNTGTATFSGFLNEVDSIGGFKGGLVWNGGLQYRTPVSGSNQYVTLDSVISKGDFSKLVIRCTGSLREFFYNGTKLGTSLNSDNAGTDTDGFRFYYNSATANFFSPSYSQINVFPTALTDAECIDLTTL